MEMTADLAKRKFGALLEEAEKGVVTISRHGRRRYVVMHVALYDVLHAAWRAQRERKTLLALDSALERLLRDDQAAGMKIMRIANALMRRLSRQDAKL